MINNITKQTQIVKQNIETDISIISKLPFLSNGRIWSNYNYALSDNLHVTVVGLKVWMCASKTFTFQIKQSKESKPMASVFAQLLSSFIQCGENGVEKRD